MSYNAEMADHYLTYWYKKRYGTEIFTDTEETEETEEIDEKETQAETITSWAITGIILLIGIIIAMVFGG